MKIVKNVSFMMSVGLAVMLLGCGGGDDSGDKSPEGEVQQEGNGNQPAGDNTGNENNDTTENNTSDPIVVGYVAGNGVLVETKSDGTKLAWVNATSTACLIYRVRDRGGNIVDGGTTHCESLNTQSYGGITIWRLPAVAEAVNLMDNVDTTGANRIIYPNDNPGCQFMATTTRGRFAYTTNRVETGFFDEPTRATAGIRCVATQ